MEAAVQVVVFLLVLDDTGIGGAELRLVEGVAILFLGLLDLLLNLVLILCHLLLDEYVGAIALLGVAVVDEGIVEGIDVSAGLPRGGVHEDSGVDAHDILVQEHHRLPPVLLYIVLELHAVLSVVIDRAQAVVDVTGGENEAVLFAVRHYLFENIFLLCHFYIPYLY